MNRRFAPAAVVLALGIAVAVPFAMAQTGTELEVPKQPENRRPARDPGLPIDLRPIGSDDVPELEVGEKAPSFSLEGTQGRWQDLSAMRGDWTVLVFSSDRGSLARLAPGQPALGRMGARLVGVSADGWDVLAGLARRQGVGYTLLSDPTREVSRLYGLYDPAEDAIEPGVVVLDPGGVVRWQRHGPLPPAEQLARWVAPVMVQP